MATKICSVVTGGSNSHQTTSAEINGIATDFISQGVVGAVSNTSGVAPATGAFAVNAIGTPNMSVRVTNGVAYVTATPTGGTSQTFRVTMDATEDVTIAANATGGTRYDWIYLKLDADKLVNPAVAADDVATLVSSRSTSSSTDNGTPPTYGYNLAIVTVSNGASSITNSNITDSRVQTGANSVLATSVRSTPGNHLSLVPGTSKLVKSTVLRQDITTNSYKSGNTVTLTGWGYVAGVAAAQTSQAVTFGVTFTDAPIVVCQLEAGYTSSAPATLATAHTAAESQIQVASANWYNISTTGFTVYINRVANNFTVGRYYRYTWIAVGEIA